MSEKILSDEEKDALISGVESGAVEVQTSSGPSYAQVTEFRIPKRAFVAKDSYPRLKILNQQISERLRRDVEQLLQREVSIQANDLQVVNFGQACEPLHGLSAVIVFSAPPLAGKGLLVLDTRLVTLLVDSFFGGKGECADATARNSLTAGEISLANLFSTITFSAVKDTWAPLQEIELDRLSTEQSVELVDIVGEGDVVVDTAFDVEVGESAGLVHLIWPLEMIKPLLPIFNGEKRNRDPSQDARWAAILKRKIAESVVTLSTNVGHKRVLLGDVTALEPGDVIDIENPHRALVTAKNVQLLNGRLGVHRGRNAVETTSWIDDSDELPAQLGN